MPAWLWLPVGIAIGWLMFSGASLLVLALLLSGAPEQPPHRTGGKPWET